MSPPPTPTRPRAASPSRWAARRMQGGLSLVLVRAWFVAALLSTCGSLVFTLLIAPGHAASRRLAWLSLGLASLGLLAWTLLQTGEIADSGSARATLSALAPVLAATQFGHLVLLQAALLAACAAWLALRRLRVATILAAATVAVQAGHGHGMAMGGIGEPVALCRSSASAGGGGLDRRAAAIAARCPSRAAGRRRRRRTPVFAAGGGLRRQHHCHPRCCRAQCWSAAWRPCA